MAGIQYDYSVTGSTVISVPISQPDRFELGQLQISDTIYVGNSTSVTLNFVNKGKNPVSNLEARLTGTNLGAGGYQYLGNLNALRDWGYAKDYVECMWLILQQPTPDDFVIATGEYHTVREFATLAFREVGIELEWSGEGVDEKGTDKATGRVLVEVDPKYFRPAEVEQLLGNPAKAKEKLGWDPRKTSFEELVRIMVKHDMTFVKKLFLKAQVAE